MRSFVRAIDHQTIDSYRGKSIAHGNLSCASYGHSYVGARRTIWCSIQPSILEKLGCWRAEQCVLVDQIGSQLELRP